MNNNTNKILSYLLILLSLFVVVLFTKDSIFDLQTNLDLNNSKDKDIQDKRFQFQKLKKIKVKLEEKGDTEVARYAKTPTEDEIIDYIYSLIEKGNKGGNIYGLAYIKSISMTKGKKNELGFLESNITLNLSVQKEIRMKSILDSLVSDTSKYKFFIDTFSYTKPQSMSISTGSNSTYMNITIPLKIFYK